MCYFGGNSKKNLKFEEQCYSIEGCAELWNFEKYCVRRGILDDKSSYVKGKYLRNIKS